MIHIGSCFHENIYHYVISLILMILILGVLYIFIYTSVEIQLLLFSLLYYAGSLILLVLREKFHVADPKVQIPIGSVCTEKVSYCGFIACTCPWPYSYRYWCQYRGYLCPCWHRPERKREIIGRRRGWGGRGGDGDEAVKAEVALCSRTKEREKQRLSTEASPKCFFFYFFDHLNNCCWWPTIFDSCQHFVNICF